MSERIPDKAQFVSGEERLMALLKATTDVIYSLSPDWVIMHELDGRGFLLDTKGPIIDWKSKNVYHEDLNKVNAAIEEAISTKGAFELEHRVNKADGSIGWTFSRAVPILDENGAIKEWFGTASDITEKKLAEESLKESSGLIDQQKRIYEAITSGTPDLMYVFDLDYRFTYANRALLEMWGKSWDEAIGKGLIENGYEPWHAEMHQREIDAIKTTGTAIRGEVAFPHAVLGKRLYDYILNPVFNGEGEVIAISGTTRDVTEKDRWEQELRTGAERLQVLNEKFAAINEELSASNRQLLSANERLSKTNEELIAAQYKIEEGKLALRVALEAANFGTWYIHSLTREFITDARLRELFGYRADEELSIEQALAQITEEYRDFVSAKLENAIYNNGDYDVTYPVIGKCDAKLRWLRAVGNLKADLSGTFSAFTGVVMDVTDQKMEEIRKNDFMGMVSHELKTPLTSLSAYLRLLEMRCAETLDEVGQRSLSQSLKQTKRMADMINGFLDFSRLQSANVLIDQTVFDIAELISEAREETGMLYSTHKFLFKPVESRMISADRVKIGQVISNLIGNAVKYSKPGLLIQVSCVSTETEVRVGVKDQGIGIEKDDLSKVFDRFYRVKSSNLIAGFGIGLYVSAEIISLHGGKLWAESKIGSGSEFTFTLPLR
jgi:PAS domain S-box-containing protein